MHFYEYRKKGDSFTLYPGPIYLFIYDESVLGNGNQPPSVKTLFINDGIQTSYSSILNYSELGLMVIEIQTGITVSTGPDLRGAHGAPTKLVRLLIVRITFCSKCLI